MGAGRSRVRHDALDRSRRERIVQAVGELAHELGGRRLTVGRILGRTGIARTTFYELFENAAGALRFSWAVAESRMTDAVGNVPGDGSWEERVAAVILALLKQAEAEPHLAELCLMHGYSAGQLSERFDGSLVPALAAILRSARGLDGAPEPPPQTEELVALGIVSVVADRLRRGEANTLVDLGDELTQLATRPFASAAWAIDAAAGHAS